MSSKMKVHDGQAGLGEGANDAAASTLGQPLRRAAQNPIDHNMNISEEYFLPGPRIARFTPFANAPRSAHSKTTPTVTHECAVCLDKFKANKMVQFPCRTHWYCRRDLCEFIVACLEDDSMFPPRCCGTAISIDSNTAILGHLDAALVLKFLDKKKEMDTPDRTYCHSKTCGAWIRPGHAEKGVATCPACQNTTCTICKGEIHPGMDCPEDPAVQELLQMASKKGWRQCFACKAVIERHDGCNHITCRCGSELCYECGNPWKPKEGEPGCSNCGYVFANILDDPMVHLVQQRREARRLARGQTRDARLALIPSIHEYRRDVRLARWRQWQLARPSDTLHSLSEQEFWHNVQNEAQERARRATETWYDVPGGMRQVTHEMNVEADAVLRAAHSQLFAARGEYRVQREIERSEILAVWMQLQADVWTWWADVDGAPAQQLAPFDRANILQHFDVRSEQRLRDTREAWKQAYTQVVLQQAFAKVRAEYAARVVRLARAPPPFGSFSTDVVFPARFRPSALDSLTDRAAPPAYSAPDIHAIRGAQAARGAFAASPAHSVSSATQSFHPSHGNLLPSFPPPRREARLSDRQGEHQGPKVLTGHEEAHIANTVEEDECSHPVYHRMPFAAPCSSCKTGLHKPLEECEACGANLCWDCMVHSL